MKNKNIFALLLDSSNIAYHSRYIESSAQPMKQLIQKHLANPKLRSKKWISTSILEDQPKDDILNYASAEYFVNNLISPVFFYDKFKGLPSDAIVVEVGPHGVFRRIVSETLESSSYINLIKKDSNDTNLDNFLFAITQLYELGINPSIENLYPKVEFPVSRGTPSIGSLMRWNRGHKYQNRVFPDRYFKTTSADMNVIINLNVQEERYYCNHRVDGVIIFPATGYLMLAWRIYAASVTKNWVNVPVVFENVQFRRAVLLNEDVITKIKVIYSRKSGDFFVYENDQLCCLGKVYGPIDDSLLLQSQFYENQNRVFENEVTLTKDDIYKDLRVRGYDYSGEFQKLRQIRTNDFKTLLGECEWDGNVVSFLDNLLQAQLLALPSRKLMIPVVIKHMRIDPKALFETIRHNKVNENSQSDSLGQEDAGNSNIDGISEDQGEMQWSKDRNQERFAIYKSFIPFYFDANTKILIAPGIEIENVMVLPIPRKMPSSLVLDSYEWVANEDHNAIDECDKQSIIEYLEVINVNNH